MNRDRKRSGALRGWRVLLCTAALLGILAIADLHIKRSAPPIAGFCPDNARWITSAGDFTGLWRKAAATDAAARVAEEWPRPLGAVELAIRKQTGIRPTPERWRLWMGNRFVVAGSPDGVGLCVFPGVLAYLAHAAQQMVTFGEDEAGCFGFGTYSYGWRDGFLIISKSRAYVLASLAAQAGLPLEGASGQDLAFELRGPHEGYLRILPEEDFPVQGRIRTPVSARQQPLTLPEAWPDHPVASLTIGNWRDLQGLFGMLNAYVREDPLWKSSLHTVSETWAHWREAGESAPAVKPETLLAQAQVTEMSLAVTSVDLDHGVPVPRMAMAFRGAGPVSGAHPFLEYFGHFPQIPYEWDRQPGVLVPVFGEEVAICFGRSGRDWLLTTREPDMDALAGALDSGPAVQADAALRVRWDEAARIAEDLLRFAAEYDLLPHRNKADVIGDLVPMARGIGCLGELTIDGHAEPEWLAIEGFLARDLDEDSSQ